MRRIFAVLGVIIGFGGAALAADLPPSPPPRAPAVYVPAVLPVYNWAGVYIGGLANGPPIPVSVGLTENLIRAGVNFKFSF